MRYAWAVDLQQMDDLLALWAPDGVFDETPVGLSVSKGRQELERYFREDVFALFPASAHLTSNHLITDLTETSARGRVAATAEAEWHAGGVVRAVCWYEDEYVKTAEGWQFKSRIVRPLLKPDLGPLLQS